MYFGDDLEAVITCVPSTKRLCFKSADMESPLTKIAFFPGTTVWLFNITFVGSTTKCWVAIVIASPGD